MLKCSQLIGVLCLGIPLLVLAIGMATPEQATPSSDTRVGTPNRDSDAKVAADVPPERLPPAERVDPREAAAVREILQIRREQGDLFAGTVFDEVRQRAEKAGAADEGHADQEFLRALRRVIRTSPESAPDSAPGDPRVCESSYAERIRLERQGEPADAALVRALRQACRQLDRKANDLEALERLEDADQLRRLSARLRAEGRRWITSPAAGPSSATLRQAERAIPRSADAN